MAMFVLPMIYMFISTTTQNAVARVNLRLGMPTNLRGDILPKVGELVRNGTFTSRAKELIWEYWLKIFQGWGGLNLKPFGFHPKYPFIHPIPHSFSMSFPEDYKWLL